MQQQPTYLKSLDALRFLSFVAIFTFHFNINAIGDGTVIKTVLAIKNSLFLGVDFFFVLSSFLLTYLALNEYKNTSNFSFKKFMMRRVLRIWPLYFLMILAGFVVLPVLSSKLQTAVTLPPLGYYLIFASNFYNVPHVFFLMFLWSIAVEEQLYLMFALVYKFFIFHLKTICVGMLTAYLIFIVMASKFDWNVYTNTINYLPNFAAGALLALLFTTNSLNKITLLSSAAIVSIYATTFLLIVLSINLTSGIFSQLISKLLMCFFFAFAIVEQLHLKNSPLKLDRFSILTWLGKRTYGLYCYHGIVFTLYTFVPAHFKTGVANQLIAYVATMLLTFLLAAISYRFFESPFLLLKKKFY